LFALTPSALLSQTAGTVNGLVTDSSGAAVSGATVTLTDKATDSQRTTTTNEAGRYVFVEVPSGTYDLSISKTGFRVTKLADQKVTVGTELTLNAALEVGTISQTVEVTAVRGAQLQTENATMGSTVSGDTLLALPNLNRDATSLLTLQPATAPTVGGGNVYGGQVAGSLSDQNTYQLDGGNFTSDLEGDNGYQHSGMGAIPTPVESIEEFKVATNNQTADFFSSAGGQVMLVTKRGTNSFHGSAYEYFQSQLFDANTWSNNRLGNPIVKFHDNRFGGSVGGPLLPGKHLGEILIAATGEAHKVQLAIWLGKHPGERVRRLQRGDDALQAGQHPEGRDRVAIGHRLIARASAIAQVGVLGPGPRVVQAR